MENIIVNINPPFIKLEQLLKLTSACSTGGEAKQVILDGKVKVNGEICLMRGKKLYDGDTAEYNDLIYTCKVLE